MSEQDHSNNYDHSKHSKNIKGDIVAHRNSQRLKKKFYEEQLSKIQAELVKMQYWIKATGYRIVILFEGRDAAGKGGAIKRLTEPMNPRGCRVVAIGTPSEQQKNPVVLSTLRRTFTLCRRNRHF